MTENELKARTKSLALRVIHLTEAFPRTITAEVIAKQVVRSSTSVAANYRAACRARSRADFISKLSIVEEEADETLLWLEFVTELKLVAPKRMSEILSETQSILAIIAASAKTARSRNQRDGSYANRKPKTENRKANLENPDE